MIKKNGLKYEFVKAAAETGTYSTGSLTKTGGSEVKIDGYGVVLEYLPNEIDGKFVMFGDKKMLFVSDSAPLAGMKTEIDGEQYRIMRVNAFRPANVTVFYTLTLRS